MTFNRSDRTASTDGVCIAVFKAAPESLAFF